MRRSLRLVPTPTPDDASASSIVVPTGGLTMHRRGARVPAEADASAFSRRYVSICADDRAEKMIRPALAAELASSVRSIASL